MDDSTPSSGRRVPLRFINDDGRSVVATNTDRTEHWEGDPDDWASLPADTVDQWDATCWFPADGSGEAGRPEMLPIPLHPGGTP
ncbi:hypothetical protein [Streptomyces sp. P9-A2]|uniref:hypothetical protein n=1 Tax=Streptomyces sp. P9-A2 TaxID=3072284 RepID=UPI002FC6AC2B